MTTKHASLLATACLALASPGAAGALPGRVEYAVNLGKATAPVGRFLPAGPSLWREGKAWNQEKTGVAAAAPAGYADEAAIYNTYVYPNDTTAGVSATYELPGLAPGGEYTLRVHVCEVYFQWADCRRFDIAVNGETKVSGLDIFPLAGNAVMQGAYVDIAAAADGDGKITILFTNVKDQFNVCALEVFSDAEGLPVPSPRVRRESRGVNALAIETRNAAYLYDVESRYGASGAPRRIASGVSGTRLVHTGGREATQYRARAVLDGAAGEWSAWTAVDGSALASDAPFLVACAESGQAAPDGWQKDAPFRVFPASATVDSWTKWENFDLTWFDEGERPPLKVFNLAVKSATPLAYRFAGLDPERAYRVRIHQMEPWTAVNSGGWRSFAYHFNNALDRAAAKTGETQVDPYVLAGNAVCRAAAVDYEVTPDAAGAILVAGENLKDVPYWFGFEVHPLGEVQDPPPDGTTLVIR